MTPKVVSEETKYKGQWFDIVEQKVDLGNDKTVSWEMIKSNDAVAMIALDDNNNVYLSKEFKPAQKDFIYTTATGFADKQDSEETLKEQARKELREEFGFNAERIEKLATVLTSGRSTTKWHIYLAQEIYNDPLEKDEGETIEVFKLPINEALKLLMTNKPHFVALLGLLLVKEKLRL